MHGQYLLVAAVILQRAAREILHHHIRLFGLDDGFVNLDDVWVVKPARHRAFGPQQLEQPTVPLGLVLGLVVETDELQRNGVWILGMLRQIDRCRRTATDLPDQLVLADFVWIFFHTCFTPHCP